MLFFTGNHLWESDPKDSRILGFEYEGTYYDFIYAGQFLRLKHFSHYIPVPFGTTFTVEYLQNNFVETDALLYDFVKTTKDKVEMTKFIYFNDGKTKVGQVFKTCWTEDESFLIEEITDNCIIVRRVPS